VRSLGEVPPSARLPLRVLQGETILTQGNRGEEGARTPGSSVPSRLSALLRDLARDEVSGGGRDRVAAPTPGVVIGRFELVRELGRGGFGIVYEARDTELGRTVAFKVVRPGRQTGLREERLLREAEVVARLSHPNIVTVFDVGRCEYGPYLILEFLGGQSLAQRLRQGPLTTAEALRIGTEVARGLAHAHAHGVVHRDLTPSNVFLCDDGRVKVLDLGLAHVFGRRRVDGGTPGFMAPEQAGGAPEDERTDVFALGVLLHRMLAGQLPYPDSPPRSGQAPDLVVPGIPLLGALVARMLDADPVNRPRDAEGVLPTLATCQQELERLSPGDRQAPARTRRLASRRWVGMSALTLVVIVLLAAGAWRGACGNDPTFPGQLLSQCSHSLT